MNPNLYNPAIVYLACSLCAAFAWFLAHLFIERRLRRAYDDGYLACIEHTHSKEIAALKDSLPCTPAEPAPQKPAGFLTTLYDPAD